MADLTITVEVACRACGGALETKDDGGASFFALGSIWRASQCTSDPLKNEPSSFNFVDPAQWSIL